MSEVVWLVDYEGVQKIDQARIPANARLKVFIGTKQNKLPTELVKLREALGGRFEWTWINGTAGNALDFHIACHLGECLVRTQEAEFLVLSKDKGFDPLLRHLKSRGIKCRRDGQDKQVKPAAKAAFFWQRGRVTLELAECQD
ncbi:MAG: PIN domain-containing protein [Steroidobacteraceae bacterium]